MDVDSDGILDDIQEISFFPFPSSFIFLSNQKEYCQASISASSKQNNFLFTPNL